MAHDVRVHWRNQSYSALHFPRERVENAVQDCQRTAYEEVQTAAALATSRVAQMTSRFRNMANNAEASFSQQQRGLLSEITSESAQSLETQRHSLGHEATGQMMRRGTHHEEVLSQLGSELQYYHHHEGQSEEFPQSQAEWRQPLERSHAARVQLRNLF